MRGQRRVEKTRAALSGRANARRVRATKTPDKPLAFSGFCFLKMEQLALPASFKILVAGHTEQVKLDKFHHPAVRTPAAVELQEQGRDEGEINFNGYTAEGIRKFVCGVITLR
jgi:hypothetical protein